MPKQERKTMNVPVNLDVHAMLGLLKKKYKVRKMSDAIKQMIKECDNQIYEQGLVVASVRGQYEDDGETEELEGDE